MADWKRCKNFDVYEVSDEGEVRNRRTGRTMKTFINEKGYKTVQLHNNGRPYTKAIHRLVAETFYDVNYENFEVNHIDGNKLNNNIANLEWCTKQENIAHAYRTGLVPFGNRKRVMILETGQNFNSINECAEYLGVHRTAVGKCANGETSTCCGFHIIFE